MGLKHEETKQLPNERGLHPILLGPNQVLGLHLSEPLSDLSKGSKDFSLRKLP